MKTLRKPAWNKGFKSGMTKTQKELIQIQYKAQYLIDKVRRARFTLPVKRKIKGKWISIG